MKEGIYWRQFLGRSEEDDKRPRTDGQEQCENSAVVKKSSLNTKNTL